jgi:RHS repeat-associated protein
MGNYDEITKTSHGSWTHTYSRRIVYSDFEQGHYSAKVYRHDGRVLQYYNVINHPSAGLNVLEKLEPIMSGEQISGWRFFPGDDSVEIYDSLGRLTSITDRNGWKQTITYDTGMKVSDAFGRTITFVFSGQSLTVTDPGLNKFVYQYDSSGKIIKATYPDGNFRTYLYNEAEFTSGADLPGALTGIIDENGARYATWHYDVNGRAISSEHANGVERVQLDYTFDEYSPDDFSTTVTDAAGATRTHDFRINRGDVQPTGWSGTCASCSNNAPSKDYDAFGNLREITDQNGNKTTFVFDEPNHRELSRNESGRVTETEWHPKFRLPTLITQPKLSTKFTYDDDTGLLLEKTVTDLVTNKTRVWTFTYNGRLLSSVKGPRVDVTDLTQYTYDAKGNLATVKNAVGKITKFTLYDENGHLLEMSDPNGLVIKFIYNGRGKLTQLTRGTAITTYKYDNAGQLKLVTWPTNATLKYTYDDAHRVTDIETEDGERIHFTLDLMGRHERDDVFNAAGTLVQTKSSTFDLAGQLHEAIDAYNNRTTYTYDNNGNMLTAVDALMRLTSFHNDEFDRVDEITLNDQQSKITTEFDDNDNVASVTSASGLKVGYDLDSFGNRKATNTTDIDAMSLRNDFDAAGNTIWNVGFLGVVTTYTYDALGRLKTVSAPGATPVTLTYDVGINGNGHLTGAVDESGSTALTYYQDGNLATVVRRVGAISLSSAYKYDLAGRLTQITYPSGRVLAFSYVNGKIVGLAFANQQVLSSIKYHPFGAPSEWTWGNGKSYAKKYNLNGEVESYDQAGSVKSVHRDAAGRIIGIDDNLRADLAQSFKYDNFDHLSEYRVSSSAVVERKFTYDVEGNRKTVELGGKLFTYTYAPGTNYLVSAPGPVARQWAVLDAATKTFTDGANIFTLDSYRRIASVKNAEGITTYLRDYTGRRVSKKLSNGATVHYVYDADEHLIAEVDGAGTTLVEYIWLGDTPVAVLRNGVLYYVYTDHLNTPRAVTDTANTIRWTWHSEPFGSSSPNENPSGVAAFKLNLRFPGQYYDVESGLHYNYFRDYDPQTGRYVMSDPIGINGGINTYGYANEAPLEYFDRFGRSGEKTFDPNTLVCRAGTCTADLFRNGSGVKIDGQGKMSGVSVTAANGKRLAELSCKLPHSKIGYTTVGDILAAGGTIEATGTPSNPYHADLSGLTPEQAEGLFRPNVTENPNRIKMPSGGGVVLRSLGILGYVGMYLDISRFIDEQERYRKQQDECKCKHPEYLIYF